jgi:hypothetical protein
MSDIIGVAPTPGYADRALGTGGGDHLFKINAEEPLLVAQAALEAHWRRVMEEELLAIEGNRTWILTNLPPGCQAICWNWVFMVNKNEQEVVVRYKARLIIKGYVQCHGIDFDEVYALGARLEAVRLLLALPSQEG